MRSASERAERAPPKKPSSKKIVPKCLFTFLSMLAGDNFFLAVVLAKVKIEIKIMEITGKIISLLPEQSGKGRNGDWRKRDFILETTNAKYPKKVCITVWGDKIDQFGLKEGELVTASVEVESREFNGRWYTDVKAWKMQKGSGSGSGREENQPMDIPAPPFESQDVPYEDDVPF